MDYHRIRNFCVGNVYCKLRCLRMSIYKTTLVFAEILGIILAGIWVIYKIKSMHIDDLFINLAAYSLMV